MSYVLHLGDCLDAMRGLPSDSVDAMVTDPPSGIGFMGKGWDSDKGGRDNWIAWLSERLSEALRVLKPGAHALVWALPRTSHWTGMAIEDAGLEVRDRVSHFFGSGFPKSLDVSKAIDAANGDQRPVLGKVKKLESYGPNHVLGDGPDHGGEMVITSAASAASAAWEGWGTALKPACEDWWLCRKPLAGTVAANVERFGTGALNIDASRIGVGEMIPGGGRSARGGDGVYGDGIAPSSAQEHTAGRWPANIVFSHSDCTEDECEPDCAVAELDRQSGDRQSGAMAAGTYAGRKGDVYSPDAGRPLAQDIISSNGGASRFFYCAKPATSERDAGLAHLAKKKRAEATGRKEGTPGASHARAGAGSKFGRANIHPTVKSLELMRYLCKLITPPGGTILDPFLGSGSTGVAALQSGFRFIGIEAEAEYLEIARARIEEDSPLFNRRSAP